MYKSLRVEFPKLLELLTHQTPLGVNKETVELLAIFIVFANCKWVQAQFKQEYKNCHSIRDIITTETDILAENTEIMRQYFLPLNSYLVTCGDEINRIIERRFFDVEKTDRTNALNICLAVLQPKKGRNTDILVTHPSLLHMLTALAVPQPSMQLLDLNTRKGELSDALNDECQTSDINITSYCFKPFDYILNTLQAKLRVYGHQKVNLDTPYDLNNIQNDFFNLVITNPPFGDMPKNSFYHGKET